MKRTITVQELSYIPSLNPFVDNFTFNGDEVLGYIQEKSKVYLLFKKDESVRKWNLEKALNHFSKGEFDESTPCSEIQSKHNCVNLINDLVKRKLNFSLSKQDE